MNEIKFQEKEAMFLPSFVHLGLKQVWKENNNSTVMLGKDPWDGNQETYVWISHLSPTKYRVCVNLSTSLCWCHLPRNGRISSTSVPPNRYLHFINIQLWFLNQNLNYNWDSEFYQWNTIPRKAKGPLILYYGREIEPPWCPREFIHRMSGGREVHEGEDIRIPMADSCWCMVETKTIL